MITRDNIKKVLAEALHFEQDGDIYTKAYENVNTPLKVDVKNEHFHYREMGITVGRETTSNFSDPENFVVFECVDRLLSMGYKPEHIELEPAWKLGHTQKGGYADIWVRTVAEGQDAADKNSLLIIECKKADEFDAAWRDTLEDGAQLFSYFQQEQATKFLCLYTSDFDGEKTKPEYYLINVQDNEELLKNNADLLTYREAKNNKQLFRVWHDTYQCDAATRGLFEDDIQPYHIGKNKFSFRDLTPVSNDEIKKKYNEFATILRQHNVGAKENAFDKLVNLFLAKVVDETNNPDDLHFYWKGAAYDDDFSLQDRLQRLYRDGMEKFLNESVTYVENEEIEKAFRWYKKDPDATMKTVMEYFRALKFYSDNDFSFISVHNERLFKENAVILRKVLKMLQNIKLKSTAEDGHNTETNQFLGDLFEGFLTKGVKQSEGQYFTPMPIVRFIVSSLPLEQMISQSESIPSCIDYACGAGHFLTEYAIRIKEFVEKYRPEVNIHEYYKHITGIEKEYRLSKVSKVSAFMYGHDETNIIYADALQPHTALQPNSYDVLVANPPYAVTGFLETLEDNERAVFSLFDSTINTAKNNAIETFFMERSAQLMRAGGVAGIVLPVSVLNKGGIYARAREIVLAHFDIVALAEFGSGTFGKTGTNTVVLFLRRKETNTPAAAHYHNRVQSWFTTHDNAEDIYQDEHLLQAYCDHCGYGLDDYRAFLADGTMNATLTDTEVFAGYREAFFDTKPIAGCCDAAKEIRARFRARCNTNTYKRLSEEQKQTERENTLAQFIREIEKEKVYLFLLAISVQQPVLIVKSPAKTTEIKRFLGYEWSDSKGNEGIQYLHLSTNPSQGDEDGEEDDTMQQIRGINGIRTPLFNPADLNDAEKINTLIRQNFLGEHITIPAALKDYVHQAQLVDMLDFKRTGFDKAINTSVRIHTESTEIQSKFPLVKLGEVAQIEKGQSITSAKVIAGDIKVVAGGVNFAFMHNAANRPANTITISASGANAGYVNFWKEPIFASDCSTVLPKDNSILVEYIYAYLQMIQQHLFALQKGAGQPHVYPKDIQTLRIPLPPMSIQQEIVAQCEAIDAETEQANTTLKQSLKQIEDIVNSIVGDTIKFSDICALNEYSINPAATPEKEYTYVDIDSIENGEGIIHFDKKITGQTAPSRARRLATEESTLISTVRPNLRGFAYLPLAKEDTIYSTGFAIIKSKNTDVLLNKMVYLLFMYHSNLMTQMIAAMPKGSYPSLNQADINNLLLPLPSLDEQRQIVADIAVLETKIAAAKAVIATSPARKQAILDMYLK